MKKLINFFVMIWNWFVSLFRKEEIKEVKKFEPAPEIETPTFDKVLRHNNRRKTHGRHTQYVPLGDGRFRPIYHNG